MSWKANTGEYSERGVEKGDAFRGWKIWDQCFSAVPLIWAQIASMRREYQVFRIAKLEKRFMDCSISRTLNERDNVISWGDRIPHFRSLKETNQSSIYVIIFWSLPTDYWRKIWININHNIFLSDNVSKPINFRHMTYYMEVT